MKIGIVSMYGWLRLWDNYGTLLQNYSLQSYLQSLGHETYWIRNRPTSSQKMPDEYSAGEILRSPKILVQWLLWVLYGKPKSSKMQKFNRDHPRDFAAFMKKWVPHTSEELTIEELFENHPPADAYIVGSDQIWRTVTPLNFLAFGPPQVSRIAYAVSAPWPALSDEWYSQAAVEIKRFQAVSVREVEGVDACARLGYADAVYAADPTLLLTRDDYLKLVRDDKSDASFPYPVMLGYFVNVRKVSQIPWRAIKDFAGLKAFELKVVPLQGTELIIPDRYVFTPSPAAWINAFDKAECVVTNSFHGALFAVLMRKPFLVFHQTSRTASENCRFSSTLGTLGLDNRTVTADEWQGASASDIKRWMEAEINWEDVEARLQAFRQSSKAFLLDALEKRGVESEAMESTIVKG
ncbi:MAG: polysaccharide pyruvyl transferase family protein [Gammaproteobacteria bacterium]|nr:polysaccharide pyruvyl transferase family protein [Gammaproteobacteria bacterium]